MTLRCKHCPEITLSSPEVARIAGWRMWSGTTVGGERRSDVVCPSCAGTTQERTTAQSWSVRCTTCDWEWEDEYDEGPLTARDARQLARDHECEPSVELRPPGGTTWSAESKFSADTFRERAA